MIAVQISWKDIHKKLVREKRKVANENNFFLKKSKVKRAINLLYIVWSVKSEERRFLKFFTCCKNKNSLT